MGAASFTCFNAVRALWKSGLWYLESWCCVWRLQTALSKEIRLLKLGKWCLFGFRTSNPVGDLALEIRRTMPLRFLRKQSCWGSGSRDSESGVSSIFEKIITLGVWLSRIGGRCLFDFGVSNLVGSVFSDVSKGWACLLVYLATKHGGWHRGFNYPAVVLFLYPCG